MSISAYIFLALYAFTAIAVPTTTKDVAELMVTTPAGLRLQSKTFHIPNGSTINHTSDKVQIISAKGENLHLDQLDKNASLIHPHLARDVGVPVATVRRAANGWLAYTHFTSDSDTNPIASFTTSWTVPPEPQTNHGQTLFLFSALTTSGDAILQPVLQYGPSAAGGGNYWSISSWYINSETAYYSTLIRIQPGQVVGGNLEMTTAVTLTAGNPSLFTYMSHFDHNPLTTIAVVTTEVLNSASIVFEAYSLITETDVPDGKSSFTDITMKNIDGTPTRLNWVTVSDDPDGFFAQVIADGSQQGQVDIIF